MTERAYLCDGLGCDKQCALTMTVDEWSKYYCHNTQDESHARNKCRRSRKWEFQNGKFMEVE